MSNPYGAGPDEPGRVRGGLVALGVVLGIVVTVIWMVIVFIVAIIMSIVGAVASLFRGGKYVHDDTSSASPAPEAEAEAAAAAGAGSTVPRRVVEAPAGRTEPGQRPVPASS